MTTRPTSVVATNGPRPLLAICATLFLLVIALPPFNLWPVAFVALVPFFLLIRNRSLPTGRLILWAILLGGGYWAILNHWVFASAPYRWLPAPAATTLSVATVFFILLSLGAGLGWAVFAWLARVTENRRVPLAPLVLGLLWLLLEVFRSFIYWHLNLGVSLGYSLPPSSWFGQIASVGGVWLVGAGLIIANWLASNVVLQPRTSRSIWKFGIFLAVWSVAGFSLASWSVHKEKQGEPINGVAIQTHQSSPSDLGDPSRYERLILASQPQTSQHGSVIVLPEVTYAVDPSQVQKMTSRPLQIVYPSTADLIKASYQKLFADNLLIAGYVDTATDQAWKNSAVVASSTTYYGSVQKRDLMPFGEYLPLAKLWPRSLAMLYQYQSAPGDIIVNSPFGPVTVVFCNEVFEPSLVANQVDAGAGYIASIASDYDVATRLYVTWQQRAAAYRAVESWRPVILSADQGSSAVINSRGQIVVSATYMTDTAVSAIVKTRIDLSPWDRLSRYWISILSIVSLAILVLFLTAYRRDRHEKQAE